VPASWGPQCAVVPRQKCETRRRMEQDGQAYWSMWDGLLFPVCADSVKQTPYAWPWCPFCNGEVLLGIRQQIDSYRPQADGEGDGC
jgi:hypothetical protein